MATARSLTFADLLRRHRHHAALSQEELAERAGLSRTGISELERGLKRAPHKDTVARLADALGLAGRERAAFEVAARGRSVEAVASARRPSAPDRPAAGASSPARPSPPRLVGRARELARLERFLGHDGVSLLLLAGEPGIGKSRLLRETATRARAAGWAVLEGGCQRRGGQPPFAPLLEALARHLAGRTPAQLRADLAGATWLARLLPELAEAAVVPAPSWALPPEQERRLMFDAVARYLANAAGPSGTLLVLDDLQWAGSDALDLLGFLTAPAQPESDAPLRILGAYRSTEAPAGHPLPHLLVDLARDGLAAELPLAPLAPAEARTLLDGLLADAADAGARAALAERLLERAGGVPFYLVSCARAALAEMERAAESGMEGLPEDALPWDAAQSIRQRIALLPVSTADLVRLAAVAGRQVERATLEALAAALRLDGQATAAALEAALHVRLLLEESDAAYRFAHDLIREVASADLGAWRRRAAHRIIAEALEAHLTERERELRAAELAQHFAHGGALDRALPYLEQAGERAQAQYANAEAERLYRELLRHYEKLARPLDAARAGERLGKVLTTVGRHQEAITLLTRVAHIYQDAGDLDSFARAMAVVGRAHSTNGTYEIGIVELEAVVRLLEGEKPSQGAIAAHTMLVLLYWVSAEYKKEANAAKQAEALARALGDERELAWVEALRGMALFILGRVDESIPLLEGALPHVEERRDADSICWIVSHLWEAYAYLGKFGRFHQYNARGREVAELIGNPIPIAYAYYWRGLHALFTGDWQRARECFEMGCALAKRLEHPALRDATLAYPVLGLGMLCLEQGEEQTARQYLEQSLAFARLGLPRLIRPVQGFLAEGDILAGRPDEALERLDSILSSPEGREGIDATPLLPLLAWAHLDAGDLPRAEATIRESLDRCRVEHHQLALLDALRVQALLAIRCKRWDEATAALNEALALARPMPYPYAEAKALAVYGQLHAAKGEPEQARARYEAALAILNPLSERLYAAQVEHALAAVK
jgi:transcriptional regulator with XRE-family HTH domain